MTEEQFKIVENNTNNSVLISWQLRKDYLSGKIRLDDFVICMYSCQLIIINNSLILNTWVSQK
jgi:hypothetical protein